MPAIMGKLKPGTRFYTPDIHEVIHVRSMKLQFMFHLAGLLLLVTSIFLKGFLIYVAAIAVLITNLLLLVNLSHVVRLFRKYSAQVITVR